MNHSTVVVFLSGYAVGHSLSLIIFSRNELYLFCFLFMLERMKFHFFPSLLLKMSIAYANEGVDLFCRRMCVEQYNSYFCYNVNHFAEPQMYLFLFEISVFAEE